MYVNLHEVPAGKSMYTVALADAPVDLPKDERYIAEEIDILASTSASVADVIAAALTGEDLEGSYRVVGVVNQSDAYVMAENWEGVA